MVVPRKMSLPCVMPLLMRRSRYRGTAPLTVQWGLRLVYQRLRLRPDATGLALFRDDREARGLPQDS